MWAQVARIPLGTDGDDGQAVWIYYILLTYRIISRIHKV